MASDVTVTVPRNTVAGDSFAASASNAACKASDGWTAQLQLIGTVRPPAIDGTPSGDGFTFVADSATTAIWAPGKYATGVVWSKAGARQTSWVGGTCAVTPDPLAVGTVASRMVSGWRKVVVDLEAAYQAHVTGGKALISEYTIGSRTVKFNTVADILKTLHNARIEAAREADAESAGTNVPGRGRFQVRM